MANFLAVVDPDPDRRSHFIQTITPLLPPVEGLITNSCAIGQFHCSWAANSNAPISFVAEQDGATVVWGDAIITGESTRIDAKNLKTLWQEFPNQTLPVFDGFYAAVAYHPNFELTVAADILGLFPIYYYTQGEVALVASSPELFRYHPLFKAEFNPVGLVGILLTNGLIDGQTLWQNVLRLKAGCCLVWKPGNSPKEIKQYQIPGDVREHSPYAKLSFSEQVNILEGVIEQTIARHVPPKQKYTLLLSGGTDARTLAGFLSRLDIDIIALTLGRHSDIEMECARAVASTLKFEHHIAEMKFSQYPRYADLLIKWEHLANGFNNIMDWGIYPHLSKLGASQVIGGYSIEMPIAADSAYPLSSNNPCFDTFFTSGANRWGLQPQLLQKLLRREVFGDLVQETIKRIQAEYESYSDDEFERALWFDLYHRHRFHVGSAGWQLCFGAWPILPVLDWQLIKISAGLPVASIIKRKAQNQIICQRFPELAQLPLDRNDYNMEPMMQSKDRQRLARLFRLQQKWRRWQQKVGIERRFYYRTYDFNNAGWRAVRQQAEPYRQLVRHLFNEDIFNQLLPSPDVPFQHKLDKIPESSSIKALLGFMLWSKNTFN